MCHWRSLCRRRASHLLCRRRGLVAVTLTAPVFLNCLDYAPVIPVGPVARHGTIACASAIVSCSARSDLSCCLDGTIIRQFRCCRRILAPCPSASPSSRASIPADTSCGPRPTSRCCPFNCYSTNNYFHFVMDALAQTHWRARLPAVDRARMIVSGYSTEAVHAAAVHWRKVSRPRASTRARFIPSMGP